MRRNSSWALLVVAALAGCGEGKHSFQGTVRFADGTPVPFARIVFEHENGVSSGAAYADESGAFKQVMFDRPGDGIPAGNYRITVSPPELVGLKPEQRKRSPGPGWGIPPKYRNVDSTPLTLAVPMKERTLSLILERQGVVGRPDPELAALEAAERAAAKEH